ncbi:MAG: bifunctional glutamate N-acetyltransferase/amino-acid acetyltransferase ArgJ [Coriobacteriia bacterium]|nr:bifunctional glutamate N-acetyltransferase/amino-acid acetyltransferase ArgJ [Coriobacteriia bacterium]
MAYAEGGVTAPRGFLASGVCAGLKRSGRRDVALLASERACSAAAVYTSNAVVAAPIRVTREHLLDGTLRAVVGNAGNANACTGERGISDARSMAREAAEALQVQPTDVAVASTGVIGVPLPMEMLLPGIRSAAAGLDNATGDAAAEAIMTTDTFPKQTGVSVEAQGRRYTIGGMAKGSGMIRPDMATMLAFVTTDAPLTPEACDAALRAAVDATFNRITVDGETSTNDMALLMANGAAGGEPIGPRGLAHEAVAAGVLHACRELARMIVRDGEGATKTAAVRVRGAASEADARLAAMAVAESPLVKCALFGGDPNWGRVVSAVGASGARVDASAIEVVFGGVTTAKAGAGVPFDAEEAASALAGEEVEILVDLHVGREEFTALTCDLSYEYVRINAEYDRLKPSQSSEEALR